MRVSTIRGLLSRTTQNSSQQPHGSRCVASCQHGPTDASFRVLERDLSAGKHAEPLVVRQRLVAPAEFAEEPPRHVQDFTLIALCWSRTEVCGPRQTGL